MKIRLDCPVNFLSNDELDEILASRGMSLEKDDPEAIIVNPGTDKFLDESYFSSFKSLKYVASPSTGTNHIDLFYLARRNIRAFCLLDDKTSLKNIHASAEFTWIHIMNLHRKFLNATRSIEQWRSDKNELNLRSNELYGKSIGIVGMGRIGSKIAKYANAFGLSVFYYDPHVSDPETPAIRVESLGALSKYDIISLNCSLNDETRNMVNFGIWDDIAPGTIVVNTSRGEVVNEDYIVYLVQKNQIMFGADVLHNEQNVEKLKESPIYKMSKVCDRVVLTPHVAGATKESQSKALVAVLNLIK